MSIKFTSLDDIAKTYNIIFDSDWHISNSENIIDIFNGKSVCFTGIRDKKLEEFITNNGGKISSSVSSKTSLLIHADDVDKSSSKFKNAIKYETETISISEFKKKYKF